MKDNAVRTRKLLTNKFCVLSVTCSITWMTVTDVLRFGKT